MGFLNNLFGGKKVPSAKVEQPRSSSNAEAIEEMAKRVNWGYNTRNDDLFFNSVDALYNNTLMMGWGQLRSLGTDQLQCVGLAFTHIALGIRHDQETMPSVSAENAIYCLVRNYKENGNRFALPAIFSLLQKPSFLKDKLISAVITFLAKRDNIPPGHVALILGGNPYTDPKLEDFRQECLDFRLNIQFFILSKIADLNTGRYTLPEDIPLHQPTSQEINELLGKRDILRGDDDETRIKVGEEWLYRLYDECEETLRKF